MFGKKKDEPYQTTHENSKTDSKSHSNVENPLSSMPSNFNLGSDSPITTAGQLRELTARRHDEFKANWDKGGVVQYKNEHVAILKRMWGQQVQFIIAYDQLTREGYRLVAHDEGQEGGSNSFSGGINSYFYFQKIEDVR